MPEKKLKVIKSYEKLSPEIKKAFDEKYVDGYEGYWISFENAKNELIRAIPFETEEFIYLVKFKQKKVSNEEESEDKDFNELDLKDEENQSEEDLDY